MKYIMIGLIAMMLFGGCTRRPEPQPMVVVPDANLTEEKVVVQAPSKNRKVPPLPQPEVEIDMDSIVDQAATEVLS